VQIDDQMAVNICDEIMLGMNEMIASARSSVPVQDYQPAQIDYSPDS
jgi:hypothetical protein